MKFLVNDSQSNRHNRIRAFLIDETTVIAVLLSAVDLEWTFHRAIYGFRTSSLQTLQKKHISSLEGYNKVWTKEVSEIHNLKYIISNWEELEDAYSIRHKIIHGVKTTVGLAYALERVEIILAASKAVHDFAKRNGLDIYKKLRPDGISPLKPIRD